MSPMVLPDLDRVAGFAGFGLAMALAGWAWQDGDNSVRFPNFREHNEPACLRQKEAKTGKERQRKYRSSLRPNGDAKVTTGDEKRDGKVTARDGKVTESDGREEKRREENTPLPPKGVEGSPITDPGEAASIVLPEEGRWMPSDWPDLCGPARRIVVEYERLVKSAHRGQGKAVAAIVKILAHRVAEPLLIEAAARYARGCDQKDAPPKERKGAGAFYSEGDWQLWLTSSEQPKAAPPAPAPAPKLSAEDRAKVSEMIRKEREGRSDAEGR